MSRFSEKSYGTVKWQSPSNIALIKYWGKKGYQLPASPSLSMTLTKALTETTVAYSLTSKPDRLSLDFFFEGAINPNFSKRIESYLQAIRPSFPFLSKYHLEISSSNTFPHSSGIASSASAMSALALCILSIDRHLNGDQQAEDYDFFRKASNLARIGSGSAARSLFGGFVSWGESIFIKDSSNEYSQPLKTIVHQTFHGLRDTILVVSRDKKRVSSSAGHKLMQGNPYAETRYQHAEKNLNKVINALQTGDLEQFILTVENDAFNLHAMMMTSQPGYLLIEANTIKIIEKIVEYRQTTKIPVCFTLDAGPNVHVLYPEKVKQEVRKFIKNELLDFCVDNLFIDDQQGSGPKRII